MAHTLLWEQRPYEDTIIEALDSRNMCGGKGCHRLLGAHSKVYVHHESRVVIAAEPWMPASSSEASALTPDKIASFNVCRICLQTTPFIQRRRRQPCRR